MTREPIAAAEAAGDERGAALVDEAAEFGVAGPRPAVGGAGAEQRPTVAT